MLPPTRSEPLRWWQTRLFAAALIVAAAVPLLLPPLPPLTDVLGHSHRDRINTLVCDAIRTSREFGKVCLSPDVDRALKELRSFMFTNVYRNPVAKGEESKAKDMLKRLFEYYISHPEALPEDFQPQLSFDGMERTVCDYIAGMTDNYAVEKFREIFIPMGWQVHG